MKHIDQTMVENDMSVTITATVADTPQLKWWLLSFGGGVKVVKPAQLKKQMKIEVQQMQDKYEK